MKQVSEPSCKELKQRAISFLQKCKKQSYWTLTKSQKKEKRNLDTSLAIISLQVERIERVFDKHFPLELSKESEFQKLNEDWHKQLLPPRAPATINQKVIDELTFIIQGLDEQQEDKKILSDCLEEYLRLKADFGGVPQGDEIKEQWIKAKASKVFKKMKESYANYIPFVLENKLIQELFKKQVIRDGLSLEVFFKHPLAANFLRSCESLERSFSFAREEILIGKDSLEPELRVNNVMTPISSLPGYYDISREKDEKNAFRNLAGWRTSGMEHRAPHWPLKEAIGLANERNANAYYYSKTYGLIQWDPRSWSWKQEDGSWQRIDLDKKFWWKQIPPYKVEEIECEDENDLGWRVEQLVSYSAHSFQAVGTHSFSCMIIPQSEVKDGKVKVAYYPIGLGSYIYEGIEKGMKVTQTELHCFDDNMNETTRGFASKLRRLNEEQGHKMLEFVRSFMKQVLFEAQEKDNASFRLYSTNCTRLPQGIEDCTGGGKIPFRTHALGVLEMSFWKFMLMLAKATRIFLKLILYKLGARGKDLNWDFTFNSTYTMRRYLQMSSEIEEMKAAKVFSSVSQHFAKNPLSCVSDYKLDIK